MSSQIIELSEQSLPENCYVFKHSTRCPVSFAAADQVRAAQFNLPLYWVNVVEQRPLSNWIEQHYGVTHASPQLILIDKGKAIETWSHGKITKSVFTS